MLFRSMKEVADSSQKLSEIAEEQAKAMEQAAVSYTHLDVYKRQSIYISRRAQCQRTDHLQVSLWRQPCSQPLQTELSGQMLSLIHI